MLLMGAVVNTLEVAVKSLSRARVQQLLEDERAGAASLLRVLDSRARYVNLLVLSRTFFSVTGSVLVTSLMLELFGASVQALVGIIVVMTLFAFLILGVVSRSMGRQNPYTVALVAAMPLGALLALFGPIEKLLIWIGKIITPGGGLREGPFSSEVELREMVDIAQERGIVHTDERRMIQSVFDLASTSARAVMVPRPEMVWIEDDATADLATRLCVRSGHSRIPVIGDGADDIVGVVYLKDLVAHQPKGSDQAPPPVRNIMRDPLFVPDSKSLDSLLDQMQRTRIHIAILIDEYGGVAGLISIEDILEEIVGEIADEYDSEEVAPITELGPGKYRVVARLGLHELVELYDEQLDVEVKFDDEVLDEVDTVSGLLAYGLGKVPLPGSDVTIAGLELIAEGGEDRRGRMRVDTVVVSLLDTPVSTDGGSVTISQSGTDNEHDHSDHDQEDHR
ncbi:hemolysin family protein [Corynebacterium sp. TAE3-ERU12]|uniref:hemolysin family protein n=1 Tax=Corynebacterium sp. TAE3-ERU12 TaxID=2849491 RepID=UPI001C47844E|nr:hemolysin family protein [Corynebacterium sp. TAE3-ERU12]MBV7295773.1 hemolysin family protein [Corynebacterium sp. TAE3-ERU12]